MRALRKVLPLLASCLMMSPVSLAAQEQLDPAIFVRWGEEHGYTSATSSDGSVLLIAEAKRLKGHMKHVEEVLGALDGSVLGGGALAAEAEGSTMILFALRNRTEFDDISSLVLAAGNRKAGADGEADAPGQGVEPDETGDVHDEPYFRALDFDTHLTTLGMQLDAVQLTAFWDESFEWQGQAKDPAMKPSNFPDSELANRLAHLWIYRYYGPQPAWLRRGLAWTFEYETTKVDGKKGIGRFPQLLYSIVREPEQPRAWNSALEGPRGTLDAEHLGWLTKWSAAYQESLATQAWGFTSYLFNDKKLKEALPAAMSDLAAAGTAHFEQSGDGFEAPVDVQLAILEKHFGEDVLERATKAFKSAEKKFR